MSWYSMARDEVCCDFPGHRDHNYDATPGAKIALVKDGRVMAFCKAAAEQLTRNGVILRALKEIHDEAKAAKEAEERRTAEASQTQREEAFIRQLKS